MADVTKIALGVCDVSFDSVDLGHTKGGVECVYEPVWHDVKVDHWGDTVVKKRLMGEKFTAKVPLAEYTVANLNVGIPAGTVVPGLVDGEDVGDPRIDVGSSAGKSSEDLAAVLVLTPVDAVGDEHTITVHKAIVGSQVTLNHVNDDERIIECTFEAIIDESKDDGAQLFSIGDDTAVQPE